MKNKVVVPLEPLYRYNVAVEMIPLRDLRALYNAISRFEIVPVYQWNKGRREGMLTLTQLKEIRARMFTNEHPLRGVAGKSPGRPHSAITPLLSAIYERAMVRR